MARRARVDKAEKVLLSIRGSLMTEVRLVMNGDPRYRDPISGLARKGALSEIGNELFAKWLDERKAEARYNQEHKE